MKFLKTKQGLMVGIFSALVVGLVLWWLFAYVAYAPETENGERYLPTKELKIKDVTLTVEVAQEPEDKTQGLSGRNSLAKDSGMFFVFDRPGVYSFWMKDMNFPIDIIWIGEDMRVVDTNKSISPETYPATFGPSVPAKYVLEVNAGFIEEHDVGAGDKVEIEL